MLELGFLVIKHERETKPSFKILDFYLYKYFKE